MRFSVLVFICVAVLSASFIHKSSAAEILADQSSMNDLWGARVIKLRA